MAYDMFISYRRVDQPLTGQVVAALERRGVKVWWDQKIEGGDDWRDAIIEGLEGSDALVIMFSEDCNASKQLKKELAAADALDKDIIPVLIEDTKPKGHFLYELASRNWLNVYPNPETKVEDLADRLAEIADIVPGKPAGQTPAGAPTAPSADSAPAEAASAPSAPQDVAEEAEPEAVQRRVENKTEARRVQKTLRDFLPFKWYEVLIAALLGWAAALVPSVADSENGLPASIAEFAPADPHPVVDGALFAIFALMLIAVVVLPFRYYFRRRRVWHAARMYLLSIGALGAVGGLIAAFHPEFSTGDDFFQNALVNVFAFILIALLQSFLAFLIYGALHFQRAVRSFKSNVETI